MNEYQRSIYKITIQTEWMSESAFLMAWHDFEIIYSIGISESEIAVSSCFSNWLFN